MRFNEDNKSVTKSIDRTALDVVKYMTGGQITLSTAESCTGGMFSASVTAVSGASAIFLGGAVVYSEEMKIKLLGVSEDTLKRYTVYSEQTAREMSRGVRLLTGSDCSVGITGIAGPQGGTLEKPIGTVYVSVDFREKNVTRDLMLYKEYGNLDRESVRRLTVLKTLELLLETIRSFEWEGK
ncbi:MAG: CinA family protein [Ruminococcus sp.]|nr:CinA family protein [Ruminococcus sp.]